MEVWHDPIDIDKILWKSILNNNELINDEVIKIFKTLSLFLPKCRATATQIAECLNVDHYQQLSRQLTDFGKRIQRMYPDIEYPKTHADNEKIGYWNIPLIGETVEKGFLKGSYYWQLRPELFEAMDELGINCIPISDVNITDELDIFYEGAKRQISVNVYERNPYARKKCIEHYGAICYICGYSFQMYYGDGFKDKINIHHIKPLYEINEEYEVDPISDLIPICPNCHFVIHSRIPAYKISEVKEMMKLK